MSVAIRANREGTHAHLVPTGPFDLAHAMSAARAVESAEAGLRGCASIDVDLAHLDRIDGAGAVLLARLFDRLDADGLRARVIEGPNREAAQLIAYYRERRGDLPAHQTRVMSPLTPIGALAAGLPAKADEALDFAGRCAAALPKAATTPSSVDWPSFAEADSRDRRRCAAGYERGQPAGRHHHRLSRRLATRSFRRDRFCPRGSSDRWLPRSSWPGARALVWPRRSPFDEYAEFRGNYYFGSFSTATGDYTHC